MASVTGAVAGTTVVTPEAVPIELETANIGSRCLALLIDWLIQLSALFALLASAGFLLNATNASVSSGIAGALVFLLLFLVLWGYPTALETLWRGRTVGKAAMGLRVVTVEGGPVRFRHAAIRAALGLVDFMITSGAAAVLCCLLTRRNQRLGDLVAGTIVLRERTGLRAPTAVEFPVPQGLEAYAASLDVAGLTGGDYAALRSFLLRAPELAHGARVDLAGRLAGAVVERVRPAPPAGVPAEMFLLCLASVYQHRARGSGAAPRAAGWAPPPPPAAPVPPSAAVSTPAAPAPDSDGFAPLA